MNLATTATGGKSSAPGQYLGYSLQQVRLCHHLLHAHDDQSVSLEHLDDVAVHRTDGSHLLEQSKSSLTGNPAADRSEELWNTFANWADRCAEGVDPTAADFVLYVTPVKSGDIAREIHSAHNAATVSAVLGKIKALIDPANPNVGCSPHIARFLKAGDKVCTQIILRFQLVAEDDPIDAIREQLRAVLPAETLDAFCAVAIGMAREAADSLIRSKLPAIVQVAPFRRQFGAFVRKHDLSGLLISNSAEPATEIVAALVHTGPRFVRQLQAVDASQDMLVTAVSDYLRTEADKIDWASEGRIFAGSLDELDGGLVRAHTVLRDEIEDTMSAEDHKVRGRALYRRCSQTKLPLEGRVVPSHFIPGAFNGLADLRKLGWHPDYQSLFPSDEDS